MSEVVVLLVTMMQITVEIQKIVTESSIMNNGRNGRTYADVVKERKQMSPSNTTHLLNTENKENSKDNTHNS